MKKYLMGYLFTIWQVAKSRQLKLHWLHKKAWL